jgi:hypothetical protein
VIKFFCPHGILACPGFGDGHVNLQKQRTLFLQCPRFRGGQIDDENGTVVLFYRARTRLPDLPVGPLHTPQFYNAARLGEERQARGCPVLVLANDCVGCGLLGTWRTVSLVVP